MTTLDARALNRATLARQHLLERADLGVLDAVAHLGGLQAQEPQEPFVGLWSRLRAFAPATLDGLLTDRHVTRMHLMRRTVHLVTAADALAWRDRHQAMLTQRMLGVYRRDLADVDLDELAEAVAELLADGGPRTAGEVGRALAQRWPGVAPRTLGDAALTVLPVVQVPPRGLWRQAGGAEFTPLADWLGGPRPSSGTGLVRRYLAAYGPAATADLRAWSGLAGLPQEVDAVRDELVSFRDARGRELLDLPDAPRPDPDTPVPVRFLPAFDNAVLGYDDRSRIIDDAHRGLSVAGTRFVLLDGRVAATWTVSAGVVTVEPLRRFSRQDRSAVAKEGRALATFLADGGKGRVRVASSRT
ncbi:winged helix DNA-binding domain-containing protein [Actinomycetospora termitidis]|uniref:Winged helix DNA-binding domain-containing protein n=1 Tax=Actinomycetospora termitidis TaxID=3053470 RepID=A0ABT7M622_9PSEU|nr:winged helix DNA-binding domain-containing protein [Actinomycetospora sp. Odt1-22]MDL5155906.1 winged helix DNA-binding domain-containing protein [Actinomycetospora sp. Odt1-22]